MPLERIYVGGTPPHIDEMPIVPLYWPLRRAAVNKRVHNARHMIITNNFLRNVNEWWVEDGK
ncbi:MAG: hypothetical protein MAG451_03086 [Anaerolineales bacterium]|nr:hypothetical protein [Anaerolineales bacterium]